MVTRHHFSKFPGQIIQNDRYPWSSSFKPHSLRLTSVQPSIRKNIIEITVTQNVSSILQKQNYMNFLITSSECAVDPGDHSQVDLQTTLTMLRGNSLSITGEAHEKLTSIFILQKQIVKSPALSSLMHLVNYKFVSVHLLRMKISQWPCKNFHSSCRDLCTLKY